MNFMTKSLFLFLAFFISSTHSYVIDVGGSKGWTLHPSVPYNVWAEKMRFSVNDILRKPPSTLPIDFKYNKAIDSVLVVGKDDYDKCNPDNPITRLDDGASPYTFDKSGPYYFITGNKTHCEQGQKFHLIVLTVRAAGQPPSPSPPSIPISAAPPPSTLTISPPAGIVLSPAPGTTTASTPSDLNASPPMPSSAPRRPALNAVSIVTVVMIYLGLIGFIGSA